MKVVNVNEIVSEVFEVTGFADILTIVQAFIPRRDALFIAITDTRRNNDE